MHKSAVDFSHLETSHYTQLLLPMYTQSGDSSACFIVIQAGESSFNLSNALRHCSYQHIA